MRILMIADFYWPYLGGVEQHVRSLGAALVARGHQVAVATLWQRGLAEQEDDNGVRVYRLRSSTQRAAGLFSHPERTWAPPLPDPEVVAGLRAVVTREQPDIVHGHDWLARSFLPLKPWSGAKFVVSLHYYTQSCASKNLMRGGAPCDGPAPITCLRCAAAHYGPAKGTVTTLANWGFGAAERAAADMFIAVSRATAEGNRLDPNGPTSRVIPNFVADDLDQAGGDLAPYLAQLPQGEFLLFVGDLRRNKGLDVLLEAYAGVVNAPPLLLIGKVWDETPATFPPGVSVREKWPNFAVLEAWRRSMAGVVPSIWPEPFGIVVIEAMACGRPVIGANIGGIPDIIGDNETGLLVPPGDALALRRAIERICFEPGLRERLGRAAQRRSLDFRASAVVPQIERVYEELVHHGRPLRQHHYQQL